MTKEEIHRGVAGVLGEMSLATVRPVRDKAVIQRWIDTLRAMADALQSRIGPRHDN